jgi:hypothetical protein
MHERDGVRIVEHGTDEPRSTPQSRRLGGDPGHEFG